jgi:hypothetical protein
VEQRGNFIGRPKSVGGIFRHQVAGMDVPKEMTSSIIGRRYPLASVSSGFAAPLHTSASWFLSSFDISQCLHSIEYKLAIR